MVGKYVYRSVQIAASSANSSQPATSSSSAEVDVNGQAVRSSDSQGTDDDALIQLIRREVHRALGK